MHVSWAQEFSLSNNNNFNFLQHKIKGNFASMLMNASKTKPKKVCNTKLTSEDQIKELEELEKRNVSNYNNHMNLINMIMADNESTINLFCNRSYLRNGQTWKANYNTTIETNG